MIVRYYDASLNLARVVPARLSIHVVFAYFHHVGRRSRTGTFVRLLHIHDTVNLKVW